MSTLPMSTLPMSTLPVSKLHHALAVIVEGTNKLSPAYAHMKCNDLLQDHDNITWVDVMPILAQMVACPRGLNRIVQAYPNLDTDSLVAAINLIVSTMPAPRSSREEE